MRSTVLLGLLALAALTGCSSSPYIEDYKFAPRPAIARIHPANMPNAEVLTAMGSVIGVRREDPDQGARSGTPARHLDSSLTRLATCSPGQDRLGPGAGLSPSSAGIGGPRPRGNTTASASTIK